MNGTQIMTEITREMRSIRNSADAAFRRVVGETELNSRLIQSLIDASSASTVILDENRSILFANRAWREFSVRTGSLHGAHGVGRTYPELFIGIASASHEDAAGLRRGLLKIINDEEIEFEMKYRCTAVAEPMWILMHAAAFVHPGQSRQRLILVSHQDVTVEVFESVELRKDEARLKRLLQTTNIVPWEADARDMHFTYVGEQATNLFGYSPEECKEPGFWASRVHPADRERVAADYSVLSGLRDHFRSEYRIIAKDGHVIWIEDLVDVVHEPSKPPMMHGFMTDISERKVADFLLADLTGRLINAQEVERKRIALELHDDLNQRIALISIELEQVAQMAADGVTDVPARLTGLKSKVMDISNEIHRMSYELHPSKLDHLGLVPALRSFCSELSRSRAIRIDFRPEGIPHDLPRDVTLCVFRVAQEALQNASKHSGTDEIVVGLAAVNGQLELRVSDRGNGFLATPEKMRKGLGLTSIQERVRHVGGEFWIASLPSHGTTVNVVVPIVREPVTSSYLQ